MPSTQPSERAVRAALSIHTTPAATGAHLPDFDAQEAWSHLIAADRTGRLRHYEPRPRLDAAQLTARFVIPGDPDWPSFLDALGANRPFGLWVRGPVDLRPLLGRTVAVIGNRAASPQARATAAALGAELAALGYTVTASLAHGVESAAHRGAGSPGGSPSLAVIPRGLDACYPFTRAAQLTSLIARGGAAVSLYAPGTAPSARTLEANAQLTAALARAVVLVEGIAGSASMHTIRAAADLRRHLLAVPPPSVPDPLHGANAELLDSRTARPCPDAASVHAVLQACDSYGPCTQTDAAGALIQELGRAGITAHRSGHASASAQWVSVDTVRGELRISGNGPLCARTDYCPADHAGWLAAPPDEDGSVAPVFASDDADFAQDTAALIEALTQYRVPA
jgi:DNA processing protein